MGVFGARTPRRWALDHTPDHDGGHLIRHVPIRRWALDQSRWALNLDYSGLAFRQSRSALDQSRWAFHQ